MSALFKSYPILEYKVDSASFFVKDITQRSVFIQQIKEDFTNIAEYHIEEGETLTSLAQDFYGDPNLFWTIQYLNNIIDPYFDWPMSYPDLQRWINDHFPNRDDLAYYVYNGFKYITDSQIQDLMTLLNVSTENDLLSQDGVLPVTIRMDQEFQNDERRNILVIRPERMTKVIAEYKRLFNK